MTRVFRDRAIRTFLTVAALSAAWAILVAATGGVAIADAPIRLSSRTPRNPAIIATVSAILAWLLASPEQRRAAGGRVRAVAAGLVRAAADSLMRAANRLPRQTAPALAAVLAAGVCAVGIVKGTHAAGGADSYGYISQAEMWSRGELRIEQPIVSELAWPYAAAAFTPLGYRPARERSAMVPIYAPGLPLVMALFQRAAGRPAVFYVVPVLGALAVWATYLIGVRVGGRTVGVASTVLLSTSPAFLYQLVQPMSDVPAAAWWALTLALLVGDRSSTAFLAGVTAGLAILTRVNLVPLLAIVAGFFLWQARSAAPHAASVVRRALLFAAGVVPPCLLLLALNASWYGSPFASGYGHMGPLFEMGNARPNLALYPRWLIESETPVVLLAVAAPFLLPSGTERRAVALMSLAFAVGVFACYVFYVPYDAWWYLRYLLPAFPALMVLTAAAIVSFSARLAPRAPRLAAAVVVTALAWYGVRYASVHSAFTLKDGERKYPAIARYVAERLPERAVLLSTQHGGSIRHYSGRLTIRYNAIPPESLDSSLDDLRRLGYRPYFVLEDDEAADFRAIFGARSAVGALDWMPLARLRRSPGVAIYDPADQSRRTDRAITTDMIDESAADGTTAAR